jgi:hypothetical protein
MKYNVKHKNDAEWLLREEQRVYQSRLDGELARKRKRFRLIDAFSGAGGMSLGFSKSFGHAFDSVWANDFNSYCVQTYNANFGDHCLLGDIVDILNDPAIKIPQADVVVGGPPCQGFSLLNKKREGDPRKQLWRPFFEIIERSGGQQRQWASRYGATYCVLPTTAYRKPVVGHLSSAASFSTQLKYFRQERRTLPPQRTARRRHL